MNLVSIDGLVKTYPAGNANRTDASVTVFDRFAFSMKKGEFVGIVGPNGCGKTTLVKLIAGIEQPNSGSISIFGKSPEETRIGYVPQHTGGILYPWLNAVENIAFAMAGHETEAKAGAMGALSELGISHYADSFPYQLSGGIKQLVSIARAKLFGPGLFLFDEPFNSLDYHNSFLVENALLKLRKENATALLVSHDIQSAVLLCDKILVLTKKPARIAMLLPVNLPGERSIDMRFSPELNIVSGKIFNALQGMADDRIVALA
ncbi:hypothetical protein COT30_03025 [Candidatus Micrarchaeota archaeon CG08_land_8_20_14_0_20_49_17]|nr:MAG: hypothetical protein AUJ13_03220 [Candidatus Micrarchaeota archaeon CG1_02_49_24]PIU09708.1 MAG: hypothetical protein COT30_03025 [Candidatus Micrarchaeota archaeon CG08_land_8_20_14_0_20_49_17]PIU82145.1 MAG: hypothetical protein COS70_02075 [Candidatus Micrarchaeota archaeon CG06_land_8_20_14_3_00_50_6]PIZ93140.1 MAG: hypothetical protein COX84_06130 [Candidatus Micrarchaeota archaeon CG_4_10_14_0_2_um_filter_49_7]HII54222.1 ABC transporter ATP-binding protein [Candidatus Micrarchaeot